MRNMRRLTSDFRLLQNRYGGANIVYSDDGSWVKIRRFPLQPGMYNLNASTVLILIPDNYDVQKVQDCFVDADLRIQSRFGGWEKLPHMHRAGSYERQGYLWLCFKTPYGPNTGLIGFLHILRVFLSDPYSYMKVNGE